jgi:hypothetical protein
VVRVVPQLPALTTPSEEVETIVADTVTIMVAEAAIAAVSALVPVERADNTVMSVANGATGEQFVHNVQRHLMKMCPSRQKMAPCGQRKT